VVNRLFDIACSLLGLILLSPLFLVVAVLIKLDSTGPVFHRGMRVGRHERPFRMVKFRTMVVDASACGPAITTADDPRITRIGRVLRRTKVDELPQLFNVLAGSMSLVGPRPEDPAMVARYSPQQRHLLSIRPGMTSPASLSYRNEEAMLPLNSWERTYLEDVLPQKLAIELDYFARRSFARDVGLIMRTLWALLR
jgi:lipopolysaccharide/colanic/teichoic acid biosynthesis glycosyltransferase